MSVFSSRFGFIMATAGAAVGLGNIWRFPYLAGENGGGAFVALYILLTILMSFPILLAEVALGRTGGSDPISNFEIFTQKVKSSILWKGLGYLGAFTLFLVLSFYCVLSGWTLYYLVNAANIGQHAQLWTNLLSNPTLMASYAAIFVALTCGVVGFGVQKGIERLSKLLMPALFVILTILMITSGFLGNISQALHFLFMPDFSKVTTQVVIMASGQALFSLATGAGCMMVYGAYLPKTTSIISSLSIVMVLNILVAILAGLAIFPMVFGYGLSPASGPGLMFQTLPLIFVQLPFGSVLAAAFFSLLLFAAWTSSISIAEPLVLMAEKRWKLHRIVACVLLSIATFVMGLWTVHAFTGHMNWLTFLIDIPSDVFLPLGGLGFMLFSMRHSTLIENALGPWFRTWKRLAPFVVVVITIILGNSIYDVYSKLIG